jgi:prolyl-tRNA synthetase
VLDSVQGELFAQALAFLESRTFRPSTYEELKSLIQDPGGFVEGLWCGRRACEDRVKADTRATIRTLTLDPVTVEGTCIVCGEPATELAVWAQAY